MCRNNCCSNPYHLVVETHEANMKRNSCHSISRCTCRQSPPCAVGSARHRIIPDADAVWQKALVAARAWVYACPCEVDDDKGKLTLNDLGNLLTEHVGEAFCTGRPDGCFRGPRDELF